MSKRKPLSTLEIAAQAKAEAKPVKPRASKAAMPATGKSKPRPAAPEIEEAETITTAIHIPRKTWRLLRAVSFKRAQEHGGRASVSALITELIERRRKELEEEAGDFLY